MNEKQSEKGRGRSIFSSKSVIGIGLARKLFKNSARVFLSNLSDSFVYTSTRTYGTALLSYGIASIIVYFARFYMEMTASAVYWMLGLGLAAFGVLLLCFDKPMCIALQEFPVTDFLFFEFFSIRRLNKKDGVRQIPQSLGILFGVIPAAASAFLDPLYVLLALVFFAFVISSFVTPEFPLIFGLLIAPYLSPLRDTGLMLALLAVLSYVSYMRKVAIGKRVYNFSIYDAVAFLFIAFIIVGGIVRGDMVNSLVISALTLAYVPTSNLIVNRRLADCAVNTIIISSVPIAIIGIVDHVLFSFGIGFLGEALIFSSFNAYIAYMLVATAFSVSSFLASKKTRHKLICASVSVLHVVAIVFSACVEIWIAVAISVVAYLIIEAPRAKKEILVVLLLIPYLLLFLPNGAVDSVYAFLGMKSTWTETVIAWRESVSSFLLNPIFGAVTDGARNSNLFLSLLGSFGAPAAALILSFFLLSASHMSSYSLKLRNSHIKSVSKNFQEF